MIKKKNKYIKRLVRNFLIIFFISEVGIVYSALKYDGFSYLMNNFIKINFNFFGYILSGFVILSLYDYLTNKN